MFTDTSAMCLSPVRTEGVSYRARAGKARTGILLWLLGVPIPIIILIFLVRGCMG